MDQRVRFPHHQLNPSEPEGRFEIVRRDDAKAAIDVASGQITDAPKRLRQGRVSKVLLIHGTFAGNDIVGLTREIARFSPSLAGHLSELGKKWLDDLVGELGNYNQDFVEQFSKCINPPSMEPIPVSRFHWSGENHHLGRANCVMSLLDSFAQHNASDRVLVLAHSHGGNVLAMLSQILGAETDVREQFFRATRMHYQIPLVGKIDLPVWRHARELLVDQSWTSFPAIDVATFGTPLRYRWHPKVCPNVLHFVQHRSLDSQHPHVATYPESPQDVISAAGGDYVQQFGIAGTDFLPSILAWRDWIVERRLARMFEYGARRRDVFEKLKLGRRASLDGTTLLVDYPDAGDGWNGKLLGHAVYTCRPWLPFHLQEIVKRFY